MPTTSNQLIRIYPLRTNAASAPPTKPQCLPATTSSQIAFLPTKRPHPVIFLPAICLCRLSDSSQAENIENLLYCRRNFHNLPYCKETLCGTVYNLYDIGKNEDTCLNIPIGKPFSGHYGDITCGSCRDVIEYYQIVPNFPPPLLLTPPTPHPTHAIAVKPCVAAQ